MLGIKLYIEDVPTYKVNRASAKPATVLQPSLESKRPVFPRWMDRDPRTEDEATIAAGVNDPSAGSPTEALLRLVLPLSDKVCETSRSKAITGSPQSE